MQANSQSNQSLHRQIANYVCFRRLFCFNVAAPLVDFFVLATMCKYSYYLTYLNNTYNVVDRNRFFQFWPKQKAYLRHGTDETVQTKQLFYEQ